MSHYINLAKKRMTNMVAGRPRTTSLPPDEMIKLGEEMVKWVQENNPLHLSEWYSIEHMILYEEWKAMIQRPEFLPYYKKALTIIGKKYLDKNSNVRDNISHRWLRVYFKDLKDLEDEDLILKAEIAKNQKNDDYQQIIEGLTQAVRDSTEVPRATEAEGPSLEAE